MAAGSHKGFLGRGGVSYGKTYACLDLAGKRAVPESTFRTYISRAGGTVRKAELSGFGDGPALSTLVHQSHQLSRLEICRSQITADELSKGARSAPNLTVLITDLQIPMDSFCGILEGCASLHTLE